MSNDFLVVKGARVHNLKNVDVKIPRNSLTVITGLSGSGKSSLAFDTIYAEGQRRYVESLSTYAMQFLNMMEKPDVDSIDGLSPAISIDQKTVTRSPRSTVGTVTEIYDYLRLLFAKVGKPTCPKCGEVLDQHSSTSIIEHITELEEGSKVLLLAPIIRGRKGAHRKVIDGLKKQGFVRLRIDGEVYSIIDLPELDEKKEHFIEVVVDRLVIKDMGEHSKKMSDGTEISIVNPNRSRLADSVETSLKQGEGCMVLVDLTAETETLYSEKLTCVNHPEVSIPEVAPRMFSFNSPHGACEVCHGLGTKLEIDLELVIPNYKLTLAEGAINPWAATTAHLNWYIKILEQVSKEYNFLINEPIGNLSKEAMDVVLNGTGSKKYKIRANINDKAGEYSTKYEGVIPSLERRYVETDSDYVRKKIASYMRVLTCPSCKGHRLKKESLAIKIQEKSIIELTELSIEDAMKFFKSWKLTEREQKIARLILKEIDNRLSFLSNVGLSYLTLNRAANTLSGGEAQRIRLATQIGAKLSGVVYVLDEPSIGLHQNDNEKLIKTLESLRDLGNTVIVVEHDVDTMLQADYLIDIGPGAGKLGGTVVSCGTPEEVMKDPNSVTGKYLANQMEIPIPPKRRKGNGKKISIIGATEHNLKNVSVDIPLGTFIGVTGVSGSGKSSLINDILVRKVSQTLYRSKAIPGEHEEIKGIEHIDKIINIDQSPIGRTPRSNPATYTGVFNDIRDLFASMPESKVRGYKSGRFSFNVKGGRCEGCQGDGIKKIEMHFLPDIYVTCEKCNGKRYNPETLDITYRNKNISDILEMTVNEALDFFHAIPSIANKLKTLSEVGLSYIHLGQSAITLSGGEAQRIKLSTELSKRSTGKTLYILDEPTTGLHFDDVKKLLEVLQRLVDKGNTVLVIEHNLDVIKSVDHIIDIGQDGGVNGGEVLATGTPEQVAKHKTSYTGLWLGKMGL